MQAGLMKGLDPGLGSLQVFLSLLCISAVFCFACAGLLCVFSHLVAWRLAQSSHTYILQFWSCSETRYQFLSLLPIWGRDFPIDPFASGCPHWPVSCGCLVIVVPEDPPLRFEMLPMETEVSQVDTVLVYFYLSYSMYFKEISIKS